MSNLKDLMRRIQRILLEEIEYDVYRFDFLKCRYVLGTINAMGGIVCLSLFHCGICIPTQEVTMVTKTPISKDLKQILKPVYEWQQSINKYKNP